MIGEALALAPLHPPTIGSVLLFLGTPDGPVDTDAIALGLVWCEAAGQTYGRFYGWDADEALRWGRVRRLLELLRDIETVPLGLL